MKRILAALLLSTLFGAAVAPVAALSIPPQDDPIVGGYQEVSTRDAGVLSAARFAVATRARRQRARITLVSVERAERQVVAGFNYRLALRVRSGGRIQNVTAVVYEDTRRRLSLSSWELAGGADAPTGREVKVFLVALDDDGRDGKRVGCGDSLVAVTRNVPASAAPLRVAVEELLSIPQDFDGRLRNFWLGRGLRVTSVTQRGGVATIHIAGEGPFIAGVCDAPRITGQIEETARQFPAVRRVRVFVNGRPLARALR